MRVGCRMPSLWPVDVVERGEELMIRRSLFSILMGFAFIFPGQESFGERSNNDRIYMAYKRMLHNANFVVFGQLKNFVIGDKKKVKTGRGITLRQEVTFDATVLYDPGNSKLILKKIPLIYIYDRLDRYGEEVNK
jgi:hypothetical protein